MRKLTTHAIAILVAAGAGTALAQSGTGGAPSGPPGGAIAPGAKPPMTRESGSTASQPSAPNPPSIATNPPAAAMPSAGMPASGVIMTDAEAYNRLEHQGYRDIKGLTKGTDGMWHATATRGAVKVTVMVGPHGKITAR